MPAHTPFSQLLRRRTWDDHDSSEGATFMQSLLGGTGTREDYVALVVQHYYLYEALEEVGETVRTHPEAAPFLTSRLTRLPALEADLEHLLGAGWRADSAPNAVTTRYIARIREVGSTWPGGYVAHHYTRYLGDLSGGFVIRANVQRHYGIADAGLHFYDFPEIPDPRAFKNEYRALLDAAPWDADERERIVDEVGAAYRLNTELFAELATAALAVA